VVGEISLKVAAKRGGGDGEDAEPASAGGGSESCLCVHVFPLVEARDSAQAEAGDQVAPCATRPTGALLLGPAGHSC
jgi:hypothetical protein